MKQLYLNYEDYTFLRALSLRLGLGHGAGPKGLYNKFKEFRDKSSKSMLLLNNGNSDYKSNVPPRFEGEH